MEDDVLQEHVDRLQTYFIAKASIMGQTNYPSKKSISIVLPELIQIALLEGNASDCYIEVVKNPLDSKLIIRPKVYIDKPKKKKGEDDDED